MNIRRFIVEPNIWAYQGVPTKIIAGYLTQDDKKNIIVKTSSVGCSLIINSYEYKIPKKDAHEMLELCNNKLIKKIRYKYHFEGRTWYIDVFKDGNEGLFVAEVDYENDYFEKPEWCLEEITYQPHYDDENLSLRQYSEW